MKVIVGSTNPVKIEAAREAFRKAFGSQTEVIEISGIQVDSGVVDQPRSLVEAHQGAFNRATQALASQSADFGLGIEAGIQEYSFGWTTAGVVVIIDRQKRVGRSISNQLFLPSKIIELIDQGKELGEVLDELTGRRQIKHQEGAFGFFTDKLITRSQGYQQAVIFALSRFLKPELF